MIKSLIIKKIALVTLFLTVTNITYAGAPLWLFQPLSPTQISITDHDTSIINYKVTNQSKKTHTLSMKTIPGITQVTSSGNCPNPFVLGYQQSCTLSLSVNGNAISEHVVGGPVVCQQRSQLQCYQPSQQNSLNITKTTQPNNSLLIAAGVNSNLFPSLYSSNNGASWSESTLIGGSNDLTFDRSSCSGTNSSAICTAIGHDNISNSYILYQSTNGGSTWSPVITDGVVEFTDTSCTGSGTSALCTAVGFNVYTTQRFLYQTTNGGGTWNIVPVSVSGARQSTSCSGSGSTALCTVAGDDSITAQPFLYQTTDGGNTWNQVTISVPGNFRATSCSVAGSSSICTAVGRGGNKPLIYQSINGGAWNQITTSGVGILYATSCSGSGSTAVCTAVGQLTATKRPLLYQRINGGSNWSLVTTTSNQGIFNATSCSVSGSTSICIAAGQDSSTTPGKPLLYQSINGGLWTEVITGINQGIFNATSCTAGICTAVGQDTTTLLPILYQTTDVGSTWNRVDTGPVQGGFKATSCTNTLCISIGFLYPTPLLYVSLDGGTNRVDTSNITTNQGGFSAVSCSSQSSPSICTVVGRNNKTGLPLLYQSTNGGSIWDEVIISNQGQFLATSCSETSSRALCTAVGQDSSTKLPLLYQSTNGGSAWSVVSTPNIPQGYFLATTCNGAGGSPLCLAAGQKNTSSVPLLYQSIDGGTSWNPVTTSGQGDFFATSCAGTGDEMICTAAGQEYINGLPLLYQSTNGGGTWSSITLANSNEGIFNTTSCSGTGSTAICIAAGQDVTTNHPLLYQSTDSGNSWNIEPVANTIDGVFNASSCSGAGSETICTLAGVDYTSGLPLLVQSTDGGAHWGRVVTSSNQGYFMTTYCSNSGSTATCTAAGFDYITSLPILYQTTNSGSTWSALSTISTKGAFVATSNSK